MSSNCWIDDSLAGAKLASLPCRSTSSTVYGIPLSPISSPTELRPDTPDLSSIPAFPEFLSPPACPPTPYCGSSTYKRPRSRGESTSRRAYPSVLFGLAMRSFTPDLCTCKGMTEFLPVARVFPLSETFYGLHRDHLPDTSCYWSKVVNPPCLSFGLVTCMIWICKCLWVMLHWVRTCIDFWWSWMWVVLCGWCVGEWSYTCVCVTVCVGEWGDVSVCSSVLTCVCTIKTNVCTHEFMHHI